MVGLVGLVGLLAEVGGTGWDGLRIENSNDSQIGPDFALRKWLFPYPLQILNLPLLKVCVLSGVVGFGLSCAAWAQGPTVSGGVAALKNGVASAPANAPAAIKKAIWAVNTLRNLPYRWGGGHGTFNDRGYDCSGTISFLLHHAAGLAQPEPSTAMRNYGEPGPGRWITLYAQRGHVFAVVAGLRLDTSDLRGGREGPRWHAEGRSSKGFEARHPPGL